MHLCDSFRSPAALPLMLITSAKLKLHHKKKTLPKFIVLLQYIGDCLICQLTPLTNFNSPSYLTCFGFFFDQFSFPFNCTAGFTINSTQQFRFVMLSNHESAENKSVSIGSIC